MVKRCVAGGCSNTATTDVSLHYFPANKEVRAAWTTAVKLTRDGWDGPTKHSVLCSEHFPADCFKQETSEFARGMMTEMGLVYRRRRALKADAIPTLFVASSVKVSPKKSLSQAIAKRNQTQQEAMINSSADLEREPLTICDSLTSNKDRTSNMRVPVNPTSSDASDCSMSENKILQNIENPDLMKEKADHLQVTKGYVVNEKQLLQLFSSQCPMCQSKVKVEKVVCGVVFTLNLQCSQCGYSKEWKNLDSTNIPAADDAHQRECTEMTLEMVSDSVPELVYFVGEESDHMELSEVSSDPGDMDSGEDWDPENELLFDEELQTESDDEIFDDDEDCPPKHGELCTDCGTFFKKEKPHTCEHKIKPLSCNTCGKRFINELSLALHTRIHDANYEVSCKYCHIKFKTKAAKTAHEQNHLTEEKPYKCPDCSETFATYKERIIHLKGHRGPETLKCHICGLKFSRNKSLRRHLVVHTGEKPFKCVVCERGFNQAGNLKSHMRLHTGEKPFKCQKCDQGFNHNVSLKSHIQRYHTPGSEYQQKKTNKRKRDSGDNQPNGNKKGADPCHVESEQDTGDDVQLGKMYRRKTNKNTVRPKGRPKKNIADSLFQAEETQGQVSDINAAKIHETRRTRRALTSAKTLGSLTQ